MHLHPAAELALVDVLLEACEGDARFVLETHSETLLLGLQLAVAQRKLAPVDVSVCLVESDAGLSTVREIPLRLDGSRQGWPPGVFWSTSSRPGRSGGSEGLEDEDRGRRVCSLESEPAWCLPLLWFARVHRHRVLIGSSAQPAFRKWGREALAPESHAAAVDHAVEWSMLEEASNRAYFGVTVSTEPTGGRAISPIAGAGTFCSVPIA